jgi:hypothetical protein
VEVPGIVPKLSATPGTIRSSAPHLGDDTDAVLAEMGLNAEQIALLRSKGVCNERTQHRWQGAGRRIHMQEVGLRDGLQMEKAFVPTEDKIALCNALSPPGCPRSR